MKKVLILVITILFSVQYIAGAVPMLVENAPAIPKDIFIPESYGVIEKSSFDKYVSGRFIILLKDAHCNYDAQHNIAKILEVLIKEYKIDLVAMEGAVGDLDYSRFDKMENETAREKMADSFVKKGVLSGPEYLKISKDGKLSFNVYGIENEKLYVENFIAFREAINHQGETLLFINELSRIAKNLKSRIYQKELFEFDNKSIQYYENAISLMDWIKELNTEAGKLGIVLKECPNIMLTLDSIALEEKIDFKKVEIERAEAIGDIEKTLPKEGLKEMVEKSLQFRLGRISSCDYYGYLEKLLESLSGVDPASKFSNLTKYIQLVKLQTWISNDALFNEIAKFEDTIKETMFQNNIQRQLDIISKKARILNGLFNLTLNRDDLLYYRNHKAEFMPDSMVSFINIQAPLNNVPASMLLSNREFLDKVSSVITDGEKFYDIAVQRDVSLVENTLRIMEERKKASAVMVLGGFHTEGVLNLFEAKGVGYAVITPKIVTAEKEGLYISLMMDKRIQPVQQGSTISPPHPLAGGRENERLIDEGLDAKDWRELMLELAFQTYYMSLGKEAAEEKEEVLPFSIRINPDGTVDADRNAKYTDMEISNLLLESFRAGLQEVLSKGENRSLMEFISKSENAKKYLVRSAVNEYKLRIGNAMKQGILRVATLSFLEFYINLCKLYETKGMLGVREELGPRTDDFLPQNIKDLEEGAGYKWPEFKEELMTKLIAEKGISREIARGIVNYLLTMNAYGVNEKGDFYETLFFSSYLGLIEDIFGAEKSPELQKLLDKLRTYRFLQIYIARAVYNVEKAKPVKNEELSGILKKMEARKEIDKGLVAEILAQYLTGEQFEGQEELLGQLKRLVARNFVVEERTTDWWVKVARGVMNVNEKTITDPLKRAVYVTAVSNIGVEDALVASERYMDAVKGFKGRLANAMGERTPSLEKAARNKWTCIRGVSLYIRDIQEIEKGKRYTYKNVGAAGIQALKNEMLSPNITHRFLYTTEEEKEAAKLYFVQNGITVIDNQFFQIKNYKQARTSEAVNVVMLSVGTAKEITPEPNDRLLVGNSEGSDLMLMDTLAFAVGEQVEVVVEDLKSIFVDILRQYDVYDETELQALKNNISYENGILRINLPRIAPFVKAYYDTLMQTREVISKAA